MFHEDGVNADSSGYRLTVVTVLKLRLALAALVGVLVIPLLTTNNGGLSHLLFCSAEVAQPFAVAAVDADDPQVTSSISFDRETLDMNPFRGADEVTSVCDGVTAEVSAEPLDRDRVLLTVTIINESTVPWRGSIGLAADGAASDADLTASIGEVGPGAQGSATMELRVRAGQTELNGTLLLGP